MIFFVPIFTFSACFLLSNAEIVQDLAGDWTLNEATGKYRDLKATVPGGIYTDLHTNNIIGDVFYGYNDTETRWVAQSNWNYSLNFTITAELFAKNYINLVFEGLDTFAKILINGEELVVTENMFLRYIIDVKSVLKLGPNYLEVQFISPILIADALNSEQDYVIPPNCPSSQMNGECHVNQIRKMQASFAWDWGPAFPSMGIWKDVYVEGYDVSIVRDVIVKLDEDTSAFLITVDTFLSCVKNQTIIGSLLHSIETDQSFTAGLYPVNDTCSDGQDLKVSASFSVYKDNLRLWWPNGYGSAVLYNLSTTFRDEPDPITKVKKIGFRTIELVQEPNPNGLSFYFKVNGVPIFAKGANQIPLSILPELGQNPDVIRRLLGAVKDAHMNMLRVWGGGVYESDAFYETADELGILIWQDLMFACAFYPANPSFLSNVKEEVQYQVRRLSSHPSIAIWAGNNEVELALMTNWYGLTSNQTNYKEDYVNLYISTIQSTLVEINDHILFVPSSPSNGQESVEEGYLAQDPIDTLNGDVHYYNYFGHSLSSKTYTIPRFVSEYGYQSLPELDSWLTVTDNVEDLSPRSAFLNHRQHNALAPITSQLLLLYQFYLNTISPNYYQTNIFYSQVLQAWSIKFESEFYRSFMGRFDSTGHGNTMGALYWQLNDVWVAPTWSSIDFTGKWKMLHYFAKDFFAPTIITGYLDTDDQLKIYVLSDDINSLQGEQIDVAIQLDVYNWNSFGVVNSTLLPAKLDFGTAFEVASLDTDSYLSGAGCGLPEAVRANCFIYLTLQPNDYVTAPNNFMIPAPIKDTNVVNALVKIATVVQVDDVGTKFEITIEATGINLFVWLSSHGIQGRFSENGFVQITPSKIVEFDTENPQDLVELEQTLTITHLRDSLYL